MQISQRLLRQTKKKNKIPPALTLKPSGDSGIESSNYSPIRKGRAACLTREKKLETFNISLSNHTPTKRV